MLLKKKSIQLATALAALTAATTGTLAAPAKPDGDPFAYLIPQFGPKALAWSRRQTEETRARLEASPTFRAVLADMRKVHSTERPLPEYHLLGGWRYVRFEHDQAHPYGRISVSHADANGLPGAWRTVFDLDAYNRSQPQPSTIKHLEPERECLAPDYERCMIPLWPKGGMDNAYAELDVKSGRLVKNGFRLDPGFNSVAWLDRNTLLVAQTGDGAPALPSHFPAELRVWKRGTPLAQARLLYRADPKDSLFFFFVTGRPGQRCIFLDVAKTYTSFQLKQVTLNGRVTDLPLPTSLSNFGMPAFSQGKLAVQLTAPATLQGQSYPADSIVAYDLETGHISAVMKPPTDVYLTGGVLASGVLALPFSGTRSGFAIVGVRNLQRTLYLAKPSGDVWNVQQRLLEPPGLTLDLSSDDGSNALLLSEQGLITPPRVRLLGAGNPLPVDSARPEADLSGYTVDIKSARAADGVSIDYYLMHKTAVARGPIPTILQGYGGFGVPDDPNYFCCHFGASWKSWFDRGGAFAIAAVRGGGERGAAWHVAGAGVNKKRSFDDFDAVAETLEKSGFTDPAHLGITGHSNGGLLTAGAVVLRPDLYGAAVVGAPVTDFSIVGHGDGGIGAGMAAEFGSWDNPSDRKIMQTWDPYFNIRSGVSYPPVLVVVATTDNQVGPSHARRFVAKLQSVGAPAMLLEGTEGGHDYPDEFTQTADTAMQMSFFIDTLMKR